MRRGPLKWMPRALEIEVKHLAKRLSVEKFLKNSLLGSDKEAQARDLYEVLKVNFDPKEWVQNRLGIAAQISFIRKGGDTIIFTPETQKLMMATKYFPGHIPNGTTQYIDFGDGLEVLPKDDCALHGLLYANYKGYEIFSLIMKRAPITFTVPPGDDERDEFLDKALKTPDSSVPPSLMWRIARQFTEMGYYLKNNKEYSRRTCTAHGIEYIIGERLSEDFNWKTPTGDGDFEWSSGIWNGRWRLPTLRSKERADRAKRFYNRIRRMDGNGNTTSG